MRPTLAATAASIAARCNATASAKGSFDDTKEQLVGAVERGGKRRGVGVVAAPDIDAALGEVTRPIGSRVTTAMSSADRCARRWSVVAPLSAPVAP